MSQNKGFSFIAVIVVMLVSIFLIVSCLTIVNNTYNMKHTEDKVSTVFYNAEGKMEQVKEKLSQLAARIRPVLEYSDYQNFD